MMNLTRTGLARLCFLIVLLHAGHATQAQATTGPSAQLNGGYYLLYHLSDDESHLPLLLLVKHSTPEIESFSHRIADAANATLDALRTMQDKSPALNFDQNPLPTIEQETRDSIKDDKQHQLLFGTTGAEFNRALLISQIEATTYAIHLAKVLADEETSPARAKKLRALSTRWQGLRVEAYRLLRGV